MDAVQVNARYHYSTPVRCVRPSQREPKQRGRWSSTCRQQQPRSRRVCLRAASSPPEQEPAKPPATLVERGVAALVKKQYNKESAIKVLANLQALGVEKPEQLRQLFVSRGVTRLLSRAISVLLNGAAAYTAFLSFDLSRRSEELGYFQRFLESVCFTVGLNYGLVCLSESFTLGSIAVASILFGANVEVFLACVKQAAGAREGGSAPPGFGAIDAVRDAVNAVKVVETLTSIRELLRAQADEPVAAEQQTGELSARSTFLNLAALLAVTNGSKSMRHPGGTKAFEDNEWQMTEAEALRIARVFAKYDTPQLDVMALQRLTQELGQPLNDEEARLAMTFLDENGNGVIEYTEFVSWWTGQRRVPQRGDASRRTS